MAWGKREGRTRGRQADSVPQPHSVDWDTLTPPGKPAWNANEYRIHPEDDMPSEDWIACPPLSEFCDDLATWIEGGKHHVR